MTKYIKALGSFAGICFGPNGDNRKIARLLNGNLAVGGVEGNRTPPGSSGQ